MADIAMLVKASNHMGRPFLENAKARTPITIVGGPWGGFPIRRARKLHKCSENCGYYGLPPVTPRNEARSFVHAFFRGLGYGLARLVMGVLRGR